MRSQLSVILVLLVHHHFTVCEKCEIPTDGKSVNCVISGGYKVKTFQGEFFSFNSTCHYTIVNYETNDHSIRVDVAKNIIRILADKTTKYELKLSATKEIKFVADTTTYSIPAKKDDVEVTKPGRFAVAKFPSVGLNVKWDGLDFIVVEVDNGGSHALSGLCSKDCAATVPAFAEQWKTSSSCDVKERKPCNPPSRRTDGTLYCRKLLSNKKYQPCIKETNILKFLDECQLEFCNHLDRPHNNDFMCNLMDSFIKHCESRTGQTVRWREKGFCEKKCKNPEQRYMECGRRQMACGDPFANNADEACVEGCACPLNLRLIGNKCVPKENCPCRYQDQDYPPGSTVLQDCNVCVCINNNNWQCPTDICYGVADVIGDPHYTTFDGKRYDFMGKCSYYLVKGVDFAITADHYVLENGKFVKNFKSDAPSWTKAVEVISGDDVITLKPNLVVMFNGKEIKRFPYKKSNITITQPTSTKLIVQLSNYVEVHWDGVSAAKVRVPTTMRGYIQGLMGNFNKNPNDDFMLPDGTLVNDANTFGHSWKVDGSCEEENTDPIPHPCQNVPLHRPVAEKACSALKGSLFMSCKEYNAQESYESCVYDCCNAVEMGEKCACETIEAHAARCLNKKTEWRKQVPACKIECPAGQEYNYCLNPCESSCEYIGLNPKCQKQCLEGCGCPSGQTFNENKKCVPIEKCKCMLNGKHFPVGYQYLVKDNIRTCVKGKWEDSPATAEDKNKYGSLEDLKLKCAKKMNFEYTACKTPTQITCKNMDNYKQETSDDCQDGCECKDDFVLNTANDSCVKQQECPCFFNGKSYDNLAERKTLSGNCMCKLNKWECIKGKDIVEKCSVFGDTNIRNLDGKVISFDSSCEYILAKGVINNKPYTITTKSGHVSIAYTDGNNKKVEISLSQKNPIFPKVDTFFDFDTTKTLEIEAIGLKLVWVKEGIFHLQFVPQEADKVEGLCGKLEDPDSLADKNNLINLIDTWSNDPTCFNLNIPKKNDLYGLDGKPIPTKCDVLKNAVFEPCTNQLPVDEYYNSCTLTAQNYLAKDDTKSLDKFYCQVFSSYARECADNGTPVQWRSPELCPIKCEDNKVYDQCISACSCEDVEKSGSCPDKPCTEGCVTLSCPKENIYTNRSFSECTTLDKCEQIKCLKDLENHDKNCKCENGQVICVTTPIPTTSTTTKSTTTTTTPINIIPEIATEETTEEVPIIEPKGRTNAQEELVDAFYDVKTKLDRINEPSIYNTLSPKDKQMIETFTNHVEEFEDEVNCYANIVDTSMCKCFNGEQICGLKKNQRNQLENDHDVLNNLELIKFMQSHLKCLEDLKENPQNCTCISGKRICPEKPAPVVTTAKPTPPVYYYIIRCERQAVIAFYNLHFAKEGLNCLSHLKNNPMKNCRCEKGQMICSLQPKDKANSRKPKEISKAAYDNYINDVKNQLQCEVKIANRQESCRCEKGKEVCSKKPEPIPEDNSYEIVKKYKNSQVNKSQIYDTFEKGLECTEEMGEDHKVCTCLNGEKECFDMDFDNPVEVPPSDDIVPASDALTKVEDAKSQIVCLMKRDKGPQCSKYGLGHINPSSDDILQLNVYLQYLRHISEQLICLRDKPSYCTCDMGKQQCSVDQPDVPNQKQKENDQINLYNTFLDHIGNQMKCLQRSKRNGKCFCDNGQEKCETGKNYVVYPLLDTDVLGEYDKTKLFPYIEKQLKCYDTIKRVSNKCSCKEGTVNCEKPDVDPKPEPDDDFSKFKREIPDQLQSINKIDKKLRCFINGDNSRHCHTILPQQQNMRPQEPQEPTVSQPDTKLLKTYRKYFHHIKVHLTCFGDIINSHCICSYGQLICGVNPATINTFRNKAANTMHGYRYFVSYVDSQLNCLESLRSSGNRRFCICGNNQFCGSQHQPQKLVQLIDIRTPMSKNPEVLYPYIDSQLKCLYDMENKSGTCRCENGLEICEDEHPQQICPPVNCPPNVRMIKECEECCPKCEPEYCTVDIVSGGTMHKNVRKQLGERWTENDCKKCECIKDHLGIYGYCKQEQCPTIPDDDRGAYEYVRVPGKCCPDIVEIGCKHNGNIFPINSVISKSECETLACVRNRNGEVVKQIHRVICDTRCPEGFVYRPVSGQCCGECNQQGCMYNGEIKQHGDSWFSADRCYKYRCLRSGDTWLMPKHRKICRQIGSCEGTIRIRDCCEYCDRRVFY